MEYLGKDLSYFKNWALGVNYCWNYGLSKLLLHFIEYRLDQLNNKHTKIAVNSKIQYFEGRFQKKCLLKVWNFLVHPLQNGGNHLLMTNIYKFHEYQAFGLMKMYNMSKIWFANKKFNLFRWNKKHSSWFFKSFKLPEIA